MDQKNYKITNNGQGRSVKGPAKLEDLEAFAGLEVRAETYFRLRQKRFPGGPRE